MDITEQDRDDLAERLRREQAIRFGGIAKAAYVAAGVNSATWTRAINGQSLKPHKLQQIITNLWPETLGDWTQIPEAATRPTQITPANIDQVLVRLNEIEDRLAAVEDRLPPAQRNLSAVGKDGVVEPDDFANE